MWLTAQGGGGLAVVGLSFPLDTKNNMSCRIRPPCRAACTHDPLRQSGGEPMRVPSPQLRILKELASPATSLESSLARCRECQSPVINSGKKWGLGVPCRMAEFATTPRDCVAPVASLAYQSPSADRWVISPLEVVASPPAPADQQ